MEDEIKNSNERVRFFPIPLSSEKPFIFPNKNYDILIPEPISYLHFHDYMELGYCYQGSGLFIIDENVYNYTKGSAVIIFKNELHTGQSSPSGLSHWKFISIDPLCFLNIVPYSLYSIFATINSGKNYAGSVITTKRIQTIPVLIRNIIEELDNFSENSNEVVSGYLLSLFALIPRILTKKTINSDSDEVKGTIKEIVPIIDYINKHYMENITIDDLVSIAYKSPTSIRRMFNLVLNCSPLEYVHKVRIQVAVDLLQEKNKSIIEVSETVGYRTISSFNRKFKDMFGISPKEWRNLF